MFFLLLSCCLRSFCRLIKLHQSAIREGAGDALRACLDLIAERDSRMKMTWYQKTYDEAQKGFKNGTPEFVHGSLIALGELLRNTGDFIKVKFKDICETILKYRENKDKHVKRTGIPFSIFAI